MLALPRRDRFIPIVKQPCKGFDVGLQRRDGFLTIFREPCEGFDVGFAEKRQIHAHFQPAL